MSGLTLFVVWPWTLPPGAYWQTMYVSYQVLESTVVTVVATPQPISTELAHTTCKHGSDILRPLFTTCTYWIMWCLRMATVDLGAVRKNYFNVEWAYLCKMSDDASWRSCPCVVVVRTVHCLLVPDKAVHITTGIRVNVYACCLYPSYSERGSVIGSDGGAERRSPTTLSKALCSNLVIRLTVKLKTWHIIDWTDRL